MKTPDVIEALGALAHEHRLAVYRLLVQRGPQGLPAGAVGEGIGLVPSSLTFHLQALQRAGLILQRREGRQLIYSADFDAMNGLVGYLTENCCAGSDQACATACKPAAANATKVRNKSRRVA
jgi:DNA-binding transcriptional ArsR family regulator